MNDFSTTRDADAFCGVCQQGNIFYIGNPDGLPLPPIRGFVGALSTPTLPICQVETLLNTAADTPSRVQLDIGGRMCTIVPGPGHFGQCLMPEQLQVRIGIAPPPPPSPVAPAPFVPDPEAMARAAGIGGPRVPIGQYSSARLPGQYGTIAAGHETNALDVISEMNARYAPPVRSAPHEHPVLVIEVPTPPPGGEGPRDIDQLSDADTVWLSDNVKLWAAFVGDIAINATAMLSVAENRAFLREMGIRRMKFYRMNGRFMAAFSGNNRLRSMVRGTTYGMAGLNGMRVTMLNAAFRSPAQNAQSGLTGLASRAGVIGMIFVTALDVAAWYAQPANERELSDLLVDLGLGLGTTVISAILGAVVAGFVMAGFTFGAPVVLVVTAGLFAGAFVGVAVSWIVNATGLSEGLKRALRNTEAVPDELYQGMMTAP